MRRFIFLAVVLSCIFSCTKEMSVEPMDISVYGDLSVSVDGLSCSDTKAIDEATVSDAQMLLFNKSGELYLYHKFTASELTGIVKLTDVKVGDYTVCVVVNGPDLKSVKSYSQMSGNSELVYLLCDYNSTAKGFQMYGKKSITVKENETSTVKVTVIRNVAKIVVSKITNNLPSALGKLTIKNVMLTNVYGKYMLIGGKPSSEVWYNQEGRADETTRVKTHIIDGSTYKSSCPDLLYRAVNSEVAVSASYTTAQTMYAYPNSYSAAPNGFNIPFNPQKTCVVITASVNGQTYYYPVVIDSIESNKYYDVKVTVQGVGSDDPNKPVVHGSMKFSIDSQSYDWFGTKKYSENI